MTTRRALVVEDDSLVHKDITNRLSAIFPKIDVGETVDEAWEHLNSYDYELVTIDLSLIARVKAAEVIPNEEGFRLLARIRRSPRDAPTVIVMITGYPTTERIRRAFAEYRVDDFIDKTSPIFDGDAFAAHLRGLLLNGRIRAAEQRSNDRHKASIVCDAKGIVIARAGQRAPIVIDPRLRIDVAAFGRRADDIAPLLRLGGHHWRQPAKEIGADLYKVLMDHPAISRVISHARQSSTRRVPSVLEFAGPSELLRVPFELMTSDNDFLCFESVINRSLAIEDLPAVKTRPFHSLVAHLIASDQPLNVLLIGVNSDGRIPGVTDEIIEIEACIRRGLGPLGIPHSIVKLTDAEATYDNVCERLTDGTVHVLHFAGHGRFDETLPEESGVVVDVGHSAQILSARALKALLAQSDVEIVVLSCCVGAQTAEDSGEGDFQGTLEAIARAGVPTVLGYRWPVPDMSARSFALTFYAELMTTLSPGVALLRARNAASAEPHHGRDNPLWACPVLVSLAEM